MCTPTLPTMSKGWMNGVRSLKYHLQFLEEAVDVAQQRLLDAIPSAVLVSDLASLFADYHIVAQGRQQHLPCPNMSKIKKANDASGIINETKLLVRISTARIFTSCWVADGLYGLYGLYVSCNVSSSTTVDTVHYF